MPGQALGPVPPARMGKERRACRLTADDTWGWSQDKSLINAIEKARLEDREDGAHLLGTGVMILNHSGKDMSSSPSPGGEASG